VDYLSVSIGHPVLSPGIHSRALPGHRFDDGNAVSRRHCRGLSATAGHGGTRATLSGLRSVRLYSTL